MNMNAANKKDQALALAAFFREMADFRARTLNEGQTDGIEVRDMAADRLAELAELIASMDLRQVF